MPKEFTDCIRGIMNNPDFKPQKGSTKRDSAYAICTERYKKRHEGKSPRHGEAELKALVEMYETIEKVIEIEAGELIKRLR